MNWSPFHHPDLSLPVIRRKASDEWLDLLFVLGEAVATRGWSTAWGSSYPNRAAYRSAMYRLRKRGLIAYCRQGGNNPVLTLTSEGKALRPQAFHPERYWDRKWDKIWYVLMYDVPEKERHYRSALRGFLRQMRMGCLQGSVWVTPHDIRPEFSDMVQAGGLDSFAYLFEARTVLGQHPRDIVHQSWAWNRLRELQADYCETSERNLCALRSGTRTSDEVIGLARLNVTAYLRVMRDDPFLPRALWPAEYLGSEVLNRHREISEEVRKRL